MILVDWELLTLVADHLPNNLHIITPVNADLRTIINFCILSSVTICKIGREFDWITCKKNIEVTSGVGKKSLWQTHLCYFYIQSVMVDFYPNLAALVVVLFLKIVF